MVATKRISLVTILYFFVGCIVFIMCGVGFIGIVSTNVKLIDNGNGKYGK